MLNTLYPASYAAVYSATKDTCSNQRQQTISAGKASCSLKASEAVSLPLIIAGVVGLALFFNAGELSHSMSFRITTGSLTFMLLAVLVLAFLMARCAVTRYPASIVAV